MYFRLSFLRSKSRCHWLEELPVTRQALIRLCVLITHTAITCYWPPTHNRTPVPTMIITTTLVILVQDASTIRPLSPVYTTSTISWLRILSPVTQPVSVHPIAQIIRIARIKCRPKRWSANTTVVTTITSRGTRPASLLKIVPTIRIVIDCGPNVFQRFVSLSFVCCITLKNAHISFKRIL